MKRAFLPSSLAVLLAAYAIAPSMATAAPLAVTLYATTDENVSSSFSPGYYLALAAANRHLGLSPAGSVYYQEAELHLYHASGPVVGTLTSSCTLMPSFSTVQCASTVRFRDGAVRTSNGGVVHNSAFNMNGAYAEILGPVNGQCPQSTNINGVSGGTGDAFIGVQGQATIIHSPGNADPGTCEHTTHPYRFDFMLLPPNGAPQVMISPA